jgi:hypothetical protein
MEVEDMATWEFLGCHVRPLFGAMGGCIRLCERHLLSTDDTCLISFARELFLGCIGVTLIHVAGRRAVTIECSEPGNEGVTGHVDVPDDVEWETVKGHDHDKERQVGR